MKQGANNEIDSLLRGLARRERAAAFAQNVAPSAGRDAVAEASVHLDADQLSAYAENALPEATRTRCTAHLADCDDCRRIVTQLVVAAGPPERARAGERETVASTWRENLAAFFSPRVWRYAMPVLVLFAIAGIGLFALRQNRQALEVAQLQPGEDSRVAAPKVDPKQAEAAPSQVGAKVAGNAEPEAGETQSKTTDTKSGADDKEAPSTEGTAATPAHELAKNKDAATETAVTQPASAPAPPPKPVDKVENVAKPASSEEPRDEDASESKKNEAGAKSGATTDTSGALASRKAAAARSQGGRAREARTDEKTDGAGTGGVRTENETETRAVAGHRFRRQNGAWVDVAFDSSRSITNVARGSEQYRALIADEPGIDTIAEQLSGQVIIVWNNRAYRIH
jgi:hypothetical protein